MAEAAPSDPLVDALRSRFGHPDFREGQREVVEAVIAGDDVVVVMPTGGGKSLCYQLPAVLGGGLTVVVSPLIALMNDQVEALRRAGVAAAALHSNIAGATQRRVEASVRDGALDLLYVAPERLVRPDFMSMMTATGVARLVVDEAHCISEWGHDFRRDYLRIGEVASALAPVQVVACTATATPEVREDIAERLRMRAPHVFVHGFARPNLVLRAERLRDEAAKNARLDALLDPGDGHAIVYAGTRARAATLARHLGARLPTMLYHADLGAEERAEAQERFRTGEVRVAVTTSAFGMGVDIPTVRQVVHVALPSSLEEYYQQAGRAGRDGAPAECVVLHCPADRRLPEFFVETAHPEPAVLHAVLRSLHAEGVDPGSWRLVSARDAAVRGLGDAAGDACRAILADAGLVRLDGTLAPVDPRRPPFPPGLLERIAAHRRVAFRRLQRLYDYLGGRDCRHRAIVAHFGETVDRSAAGRCGDRCDVCRPDTSAAATPARPVALDDDTVRRALSAVARLNGRVGLARVAAVLVGSQSRQVTDLALDRIPTYGALRGWREADAAELLRRLCDAGAVRQGAPPYPTVSLTEEGVAAMRGETRLEVDDPRRLQAPTGRGDGRGDAVAVGDADAGLFESLRTWRRTVARARDVPPYVVFSDRTLAEIARRRPATGADLLQVSGVGEAKLRQFGDEVVRIVSEHRLHVVQGVLSPSGGGTP